METATLASPTPPLAAPRRAVTAWILYDIANVVFFTSVIALYFPLWVVDDAGGRDAHYGIANGASMLVVVLIAPLLGALSDQLPRRLPFLAVSTAACCVLTLLLGHGGLWAALVVFGAANVFFQSGLIFYDALLPVVSTEANRGRVSGWGIGAGFGGAILAVGLGLAILAGDEGAKPLVFKVAAVIFFLGALPCLLWVKEPPRPAAVGFGREAIRRSLTEVRATWRLARANRGLGRFLIGRVFYADAAGTLLAFMAVYATKEVGFTDTEAQLVILAGIVAGPIGALGAGALVDRIGPKRTLDRFLGLWAAVLILIALIPALDLPTALFWVVAPMAGVALGGTSTIDRPFLLRLAPPRALGQCYGMFAMLGRFATLAGPLLWAAIVDGLGWGRPVAIASLALFVAIAFAILRPLDDAPRAWAGA